MKFMLFGVVAAIAMSTAFASETYRVYVISEGVAIAPVFYLFGTFMAWTALTMWNGWDIAERQTRGGIAFTALYAVLGWTVTIELQQWWAFVIAVAFSTATMAWAYTARVEAARSQPLLYAS